MEIGNRKIGLEHTPFTIAEVGINHNGDLDLAIKSIKAAKEAGVDAVKFQTFKTEEFILDKNTTYSYKSQGKDVTESMFDMFKRTEFTTDEWATLKKTCDEEGIIFMSTPSAQGDLDLLLGLGVPAIKVGSDDFINHPLLLKFQKANLPMILSCGMSNLAEVYETLDVLDAKDGRNIVLLLCTSQYPTPAEDVNLLKLTTLASAFPGLTIGLSDHSQGVTASTAAVALGARVFEKHFTVDRELPGPDHWFSENPESLAQWNKSIKDAHRMLGSALVAPTEKEVEMRKICRRSVVATSDISEGQVFGEENLGLRRPGDGLAPKYYSSIVGMKARRNIAKGEQVLMGDF